ncbi:GRIP and coiled-coil domain-containing protein-like isoform X2 [Nymphalis io]|uniref:GRIP and coiled-coil domain-containing protein-like isoform X2 n=1 Tax=Inachis io TaxID=171585 RepID=UPI0021675B80|nr:GRIP and coiled-coil domain-containing protein-like isoform X2 [Nymphalis io]
MLRCEYNPLFYRVLCATLLLTAFTFTVILTNVFIDIDWILSNKNTQNSQINHSKAALKYDFEGSEAEGLNDDKSYESENDPFYRARRSISNLENRGDKAQDEADNIQLHVKDPGLKKILTSRLASLLKELDEEESTTEDIKTEITTAPVKAFEKLQERNNKRDGLRNTDLFHLAMHNILLQGMLGHMDLNDAYNKVHQLVNNFNDSDKNKDINSRTLNAITNSKEQYPYNEERKLFEELIKCKKLETEIARNKLFDTRNTKGVDNKIIIKAVIEIIEDNEKLNKINLTNSTENVEGMISLIYNGKAIKVNQFENIKYNNTEKKKINQEVEIITSVNENKNTKESETMKSKPINNRKQNQNLLNKLIDEYFKTGSPGTDYLDREINNFKSKRLKRQIKIRYEDDQTSISPKTFRDSSKKDDDNVYIEIESHFSGKGIKGEKKKLIRSLIDKIQKAIRSDAHEIDDTIKHIQFVKRTQDPIDGNRHTLINKISPPHDHIEPRQLDPIDKTLSNHENLVKDVSWTNQIESPKFLSVSKSVNSAEMRELNIDYDNVLRNGIPKRFQKPINMNTEEDQTVTPYIDNDRGNVTLLLKDIDGTGFSIGINQYVGEPPDINSMKMFTGLENLIREYHQSYDQDVSNESEIDKAENFVQMKNKYTKKSVHNILKRSLKGIGNVYKFKLFYKNDTSLDKYLKPFKYNYDNRIYKLQKYLNKINTDKSNNKTIYKFFNKFKLSGMPNIDKTKLNKKLKSPEILTSDSFISRKKRSLTVKKISNVNSKIKLNKYINTHARSYKRILLNNKRNKRQINKIRIIARESQNPERKSEENIFMISGENPDADKTSFIKEFETPDTIINARNHYDDIYPMGDFYRIQYNTQPMYSKFYDQKRNSNQLKSKYPHIFINDEIASKEEDINLDKIYGINEQSNRIQPEQNNLEQETIKIDTQTLPSENYIPKVEEIINAIMPSASRPNYKLTVKITPKKTFNMSTGFKEVHTSVNKSFDENGLRYFSLFNLSRISKIEELNKTNVLKKDKTIAKPLNTQVNEQQMQIKTLLQLHKKRVDQQLGNLLRESKHLERMIEANSNNNINKTINMLHDDIVATDVTTDDKMNKILESIKKIQESYNLIKNDIKTQANLATEKPKTASDTPVIIHTVKSNDKITSEILKKIDTNTNILKSFLERFLDNHKSKNKATNETERATNNPAEIKLNLSKDLKRFNKNAFYVQEENKNATIPFIYAYQQNKGPPASLVYQGHIHTNTIPNYRKDYKPVSKIQPNDLDNSDINKQNFNESKFFMDEIENDFKVANKPFFDTNINMNITKD